MNFGILFENPLYLFLLLLCLCMIVISYILKSTIPKKRKTVSLIIRSLILCCFIFALSGINLAMNEEPVNYIFLFDISDSIPGQAKERVFRILKKYPEKKKNSDTMTLIPFAGNAYVEITFKHKVPDILLSADILLSKDSEISGSIDTRGTNIEKAINLACANLPGKGENRILLFSDGNETRGSLLRAAELAKACGVSISVYPLDSQIPENEVLIKKIYGPDTVKEDEPHEIRIIIESSHKTVGFLTVLKDNTPVISTPIELEPGENFYSLTSTLKNNGLHTYEGTIYTDKDLYPENNFGKLFVHVLGKPEFLYVYGTLPNRAIINALASQGMDVTSISSATLPATLPELSGYGGIIFDSVSGHEIALDTKNRIEEYVRVTGGGFFMITGPDAYGLSGFSGTKIETLLPVHLLNQEKFTSLAVVFAVDRSASMSGDIDIGETKLDVVKKALLKTVEMLKPAVSIGIMVFDNKPEWIVTFEDSIQRDKVKENISAISPGGGTDMFRALQEAYRVLAHFPARYRHIILLSDGKSEKRENYDYEGLVKAIAGDTITVSTIAIGHDADVKQLTQIANWGNGITYFTKSSKKILTIYMDEMERISGNDETDINFTPKVVSSPYFLKGIDTRTLPECNGYIKTILKQGAQEIFSGPAGPLFANWHYGLGKTALFLSDFKGTWGNKWPQWKEFSGFLSQTIRWIERSQDDNLISAGFTPQKDQLMNISVDIRDTSGRFINFLDLKAEILLPNGEEQTRILDQSGPGLYSGVMQTDLPGDYYISIIGRSPEENVYGPYFYGFSLPYSPEYSDFSSRHSLLEESAHITGGKILGQEEAESETWLFRKSSVKDYVPIWELLISIGLILFFFEIAGRKLSVSKKIRDLFFEKLRRSNRHTETRRYEDLKTIMKTRDQEEKERIRTEIKERLRKQTGISTDRPDLFLALKRTKKK
ncbi:MAG: VWA domain-containing protein [Spirochaetales bacterium]|nr:VWA domain-containing protein [Spirochaetales bacterium]